MPSERRGSASGGDTVAAAPTLADRTQLSWRDDQHVFRPERLHTAPHRRRQRDLWGSCDPHKSRWGGRPFVHLAAASWGTAHQ